MLEVRVEVWKQELFYVVLVIGYVDCLEPLKEVDVVLQLLHRHFEAILVGLLRHGVYDEWEALVLMVQLIPILLQALNSGYTEGKPSLSQ